MTSLQDIPGLDPELVPLLQLVGVETAGDLAVVPAKIVYRALEREMGFGNGVPSLEEIESWQKAVRSSRIPGGPGAKKVSSGDRLLVAEALSSKQLMASGIAASTVPIARILGDPSDLTLMASRSGASRNGTAEGLEHRTEAPAKAREPAREPIHPREDDPLEVHAVESSRIRRLEDRKREVEVPERKEAEEVPDGEDGGEAEEEMRFPSTEVRSRAEQDFERKNRGMTHKEPGRVLIGALALLVSNLLVLIGVGTVATALVLEYYLKMQVPPYLAFGLMTFPLALLIFLTLGTRPRCRLCGQRLFLPRKCRRHERAHRSFLGYAITLALHVVFFRWFRCNLCGTKQRLN
ncbi:MAG: hypothetical protein O3A87_05685 [Verrucomicrobia bacterium]|nr:hypothetical protein [Verrucomicrobiota bacterium]